MTGLGASLEAQCSTSVTSGGRRAPRPRRRRPCRQDGPAVIVLPQNRHLAAACRAQAVGQSGRRVSVSVSTPCRNSNSVCSNAFRSGSTAAAASSLTVSVGAVAGASRYTLEYSANANFSSKKSKFVSFMCR